MYYAYFQRYRGLEYTLSIFPVVWTRVYLFNTGSSSDADQPRTSASWLFLRALNTAFYDVNERSCGISGC